MSIQLKDGGKYVARNGEVVTVRYIRNQLKDDIYSNEYKDTPFVYRVNGRLYTTEGCYSDNDLVSEYVDNIPKMTTNILSIMKEFSANCEDASVTVFDNSYRIDLDNQYFCAYNDEMLVKIIDALTVLYKR